MKLLAGEVPDQAREFVAMEHRVVADGDMVGDRLAARVQVAAEEQDLIRPRSTDEAVALGRDERARRAFDKRQLVGNELEDVVAGFAEEQVAGLTVESAGEDVVARSAEDPLFT